MGSRAEFMDDGPREQLPAGTYPARCIQVVDLGTRDNTYEGKTNKKTEMLIVFETNELMEDGRPWTTSWWGSKYLTDNSNLMKLLVKWRGKAFTDQEKKTFKFGDLLDKEATVTVVANRKGNTGIEKTGVSPPMKGMVMPPRVNDLVDFGIDEIGTETWEKLWPWVQKQIMKSDEYKEYLKRTGAPF